MNATPTMLALHEAHVQRRARLFGNTITPQKPVVRHILAPVEEPLPEPTPDPADLAYATPSARRIIMAVCAKHGILLDDLMSMSLRRDIVRCRQECCHALRYSDIKVLGQPLSLPRIGRLLGGLDHTTVLYSIRRHEKRIRGLL